MTLGCGCQEVLATQSLSSETELFPLTRPPLPWGCIQSPTAHPKEKRLQPQWHLSTPRKCYPSTTLGLDAHPLELAPTKKEIVGKITLEERGFACRPRSHGSN